MRLFWLVSITCLAVSCSEGNVPGGDDGTCAPGEILDDVGCVRICISDDSCTSGTHCSGGRCIDGIRPRITDHAPTRDAVRVGRDSAVLLGFSVAMNPPSTQAAFSMTVQAESVPGAFTWLDNDLGLLFQPQNELRAGGTYRVRLAQSAHSSEGITLEDPYEFAFTADDAMPVIVTATSPQANATGVGIRPLVQVTFSVPMDLASTAAAVALLPESGGENIAGQLSLDLTLTTLLFRVDEDLDYDSAYLLEIAPGARGLREGQTETLYVIRFETMLAPDDEDPVITLPTISGILGGDDVDGLGGLTFAGSATDAGSGVASVECQIVPANGLPGGVWLPAQYSGSSWSCVWYARNAQPTPDGPYTLYVRAVDGSGHSTEESLLFGIDLVPPAPPTFLLPVPPTWKFDDLTVHIVGEPGATLEAYVAGALDDDSPIALDSLGTASLGLSLPALLGDEPVTHLLTFFITDAYGNRNPLPLAKAVQRVPYSCLRGGSSFRPFGAVTTGGWTLPAGYVSSDDGNGHVAVRFYLNDEFASDTALTASNSGQATGYSASCYGGNNSYLLKVSDALFPSCAVVEEARLWLRFTTQLSGASSSVYGLKRPWVESQATSSLATTGVSWSGSEALGVLDRETASSGTIPEGSWDVDLTELFQRWRTSDDTGTPVLENNGMLIRANGCSQFHTTEAQTSGEPLVPILYLRLSEQP